MEVEGPDGQVHQFPDGTDMQAISAQMSQRYGGKPGQLAPSQSAPDQGRMAPGASSVAPNDINTSPQYINPQDVFSLGMAMSPQGRAMASVINNTPGHAQAEAEAKAVGTGVGAIKIKAANAQKMLETLNTFRQHAEEAGPDTLNKAIGPDYSGGSSWMPLPDTSSSSYQAIAAKLGGNGDAYQLNLEMQHLKRAIAAQFKSSGAKDGATDAAQSNLLEAIGEAMKAKDSKGFFSVLHDADNFVRSTANLAPKPANSILDKIPNTPQWQDYRQKVQADLDAKTQAGQAAQAPAPVQGAAPAPSSFPPEALAMLKQNSSTAMRAKFDKTFEPIYGKGASDRAMREINGR